MGFVVNYPPATNVTVNDDGTQVVVAAAGPRGPQGEPGVVSATAPVTYDSGTQTVGIDQTGLTVAQSQVTGLESDLAGKATLLQLPSVVVIPGFVQPTAVRSGMTMTQGYLPGSIYNAACLNGSNTDGDFYEWDIICSAGTYTLRVHHRNATGNGIATISVDGSPLATTIDLYAAVGANNNTTDITGVALAAGKHTIRFTATGKNASSTGFLIYLHGWSLTRTGA